MSIFLENEKELDENQEPDLVLYGDGEMSWDNDNIPDFVKAQDIPEKAVSTSLEFTSIFLESDDKDCPSGKCSSGKGSKDAPQKPEKKEDKPIKESSYLSHVKII